MKNPFVKITGTVLLCGSAFLLAGCSSGHPERFNINGIITNHDGKRVNGVVLVLKYQSYERKAQVKDGAFFFPDVEPGTVTAYFKVRPRPVGPPLPPNATAEEKRQYQEAYGVSSEPVTPNIPRGYFSPATSSLKLEIKPEGPHRFELRLEEF